MADDVLLVASKVRARVKDKGCNMGGDFVGKLNEVVTWWIDTSVERAKANGRKTVGGRDV